MRRSFSSDVLRKGACGVSLSWISLAVCQVVLDLPSQAEKTQTSTEY